jgi:hypothetical protein
VLLVSNGTWTGNANVFSYRWQDCGTDGTGCTDISGANSNSYTVTSGDAGHTIEAVVTAGNGSGQTSADAPIVPLVDNFTSDPAIDTNVWAELNQQGDTSNNEIECYLPSQLSLDPTNGLSETLAYDSGGFNCPAGTPNSTNPLNYKSGAVQMKGVSFQYGTIVVRAKLAGGTGAWPTIWLLGASCQSSPTAPFTFLSGTPDSSTGFYCPWANDNQDAAEVDIAEDLGGNGTTSIGENVYNGNGTFAPCSADLGFDPSLGFHNYELDWTPTGMTFKVDGSVPNDNCTVTSGFPTHPMFLIINTALCSVGSNCGHGVDNSTLPVSTQIAWVHVSH